MKWTDSGGYEQAPPGTHVARCIKMIDIGTQHGEYQGQPTKRRQCIIAWELPNELMTTGDFAGKPFSVSKFYTQSLSEKANLRQDLRNWRGRDFSADELQGFDPKNIIGQPCMLSLTPNDKGKVIVSGVMKLPKGTEVPAQVNPSVFFSLDEFDEVAFGKLGEKMQALIGKSDEFKALSSPAPASPQDPNDDLSDIPF
jgi:hypothetical protein